MKTVLGAARLKRYIRLVASVVLSALLGLFVGASPTSANAAALECPEIGHTGVPDRAARQEAVFRVDWPGRAPRLSTSSCSGTAPRHQRPVEGRRPIDHGS